MRKGPFKLTLLAILATLTPAGTSLAQVPAASALVTLASFDWANGFASGSPMIQGTDGNFYGVTTGGGDSNYGSESMSGTGGNGTVFRITPGGELTTLYVFCSEPNCTDGAWPVGPLVQAADGNFYGMTLWGGLYGNLNVTYPPPSIGVYGGAGTVFRITPQGEFTTIYNFCASTQLGYDPVSKYYYNFCLDGSQPSTGFTLGSDGFLYGTTTNGGPVGAGTVFRMSLDGVLIVMCSFGSTTVNVSKPNGIVEAGDGSFYGTSLLGIFGEQNLGAIYRLTPAGDVTVLYNFGDTFCGNGYHPSPFTKGGDGNFYATAWGGGQYGMGTVFEFTPQGWLYLIHTFCLDETCWDGANPNPYLVWASDGNVYGTTEAGGRLGGGTIFRINPGEVRPAGAWIGPPPGFEIVTDFNSNPDAWPAPFGPETGPVQGTDGDLYGTANWGGLAGGAWPGDGAVYRVSLGLRPFVQAQNGYGRVGETVVLVGNGLRGTTAVSFNGIAAVFSVVSNTQIKARVPAGATTGYIQVRGLEGALTSNIPFEVVPECFSEACMSPGNR